MNSESQPPHVPTQQNIRGIPMVGDDVEIRVLRKDDLAYLSDHDVECIKLGATPEGQFVYEQLGFVAERKFHRWERSAEQRSQSIRPNQAGSQIGQLDWLDRFAFEADRSAFLNSLDEVSFTISSEDVGFLQRVTFRAPAACSNRQSTHKDMTAPSAQSRRQRMSLILKLLAPQISIPKDTPT